MDDDEGWRAMHAVQERIGDIAVSLEEHAAESDNGGRLADVTVKGLRDTAIVRMYQPREFGGYEAHPVEFSEAIMTIGSHSGSAGWVNGVDGVHPWELAQVDHRLQVEIWAQAEERKLKHRAHAKSSLFRRAQVVQMKRR